MELREPVTQILPPAVDPVAVLGRAPMLTETE